MKLSGNDINTVFALNGDDENSATYAFSWALSKSPTLLRKTIYDLINLDVPSGQILIEAQKHGQDKGFTDIEIFIPKACHIIFEAKRNWELPSVEQLEKYATRFETAHEPTPLIVSLSAASREYSERQLPCRRIRGIPLEHRSWKDIRALVKQAYSNTTSREEKLWLREFEIHLRGYVSMRNPIDNRVFVVSLSQDPIKKGKDYTWNDVVEKDNCYFHEIKDRWPVTPPNYIAFRYGGQLQSVHYIKSYEVETDLSSVNENWPETDSDHFVYNLGPAMNPPVIVINGAIHPAGHYWCIIDTLLSGEYTTISAARDETNRRLNAINH